MSTFKPGQRLKSRICATEVMIIKYVGVAEISCGGVQMASANEAVKQGKAKSGFMKGTQMGKRYINDDGSIELLCIKAGAGSLAVDGVALAVKKAKPLPSSD
jgi:hypothetical protein